MSWHGTESRRVTYAPMRRAGAILALLVAIATGVAAGGSPGWRFAAGHRIDGAERTEFELWWQEASAVLREYAEGALVVERRCADGTYRSVDIVHRAEIIRTGIPADRCQAWATGGATDAASLAGLGGLRGSTAETRGGTPVRRFTDPVPDATVRDLVAAGSGLPLELTRADGSTVTWSYTEIGRRPSAPEPVPGERQLIETYRTMTAAEAASGLEVDSLPERLGRYRFATAFDYTSGGAPGTLYVLWRAGDGSELQVVRGIGLLDALELGTTHDGGIWLFKAQLGAAHVQVIAPERLAVQMLRSALGL